MGFVLISARSLYRVPQFLIQNLGFVGTVIVSVAIIIDLITEEWFVVEGVGTPRYQLETDGVETV